MCLVFNFCGDNSDLQNDATEHRQSLYEHHRYYAET